MRATAAHWRVRVLCIVRRCDLFRLEFKLFHNEDACRAHFGSPRVEPRFCSVRWNSTRFFSAFGGKKLYFVGDSIAAQQWRSLLCLEIGSMSAEARATAQAASARHEPESAFSTWCKAM